jgi:hypothetical protein
MFLAAPGCGSEDDAPGVDAGSGADAGEILPFMSSCQTNDQCETGLCFSFNSKGPHCTHGCMMDEDCEDPSPGCNNMGVCKAPDI